MSSTFFSFLWKVRPLSSGHPKVLWHRDRVHESKADLEYIPKLTEQELTQWLQDAKMSTHNMSWKVRGFGSVDMTGQTLCFFFFFKEGSQAWWRRLAIPAAVQRWKEKRTPRPLWVTQWRQGHHEVRETLSPTNKPKRKKKKGKEKRGTQTWGYYRSTSLNKKRMFHVSGLSIETAWGCD